MLPPTKDATEESGDDYLTEAAKAAGAYDPEERKRQWDNARNTEQTLGQRKITFHPELSKVKFDSLQGKEFLILQALIVKEWKSQYGKSDFPLMMIQFEDGSRATTAGSGIAILNQVQQFKNMKAFPVKVKLGKGQSEDTGQEYNLFI